MEIRIPKVWDESLYLKCKDDAEHIKYDIGVMISGRTGGNAPKNSSETFNFFLTPPNCAIICKVTGNVLIEELDMD